MLHRVKEQGHAVVVVAEGAGEDLLGKSSEVDAGGNRKLPPIGVRLGVYNVNVSYSGLYCRSS